MLGRRWKETFLGVLTTILFLIMLGAGYTFYRQQVARIEWPKRLAELGTTSASATPVIAALRRYTQANGKPPSSLSALTPTYLAALPAPGAAARDGQWFYQPQAEDQPSGVWVFGIAVRHDFCPRCGVSFGDYFVYHPSGVYSRSAYGGIRERIGGWSYYHE